MNEQQPQQTPQEGQSLWQRMKGKIGEKAKEAWENRNKDMRTPEEKETSSRMRARMTGHLKEYDFDKEVEAKRGKMAEEKRKKQETTDKTKAEADKTKRKAKKIEDLTKANQENLPGTLGFDESNKVNLPEKEEDVEAEEEPVVESPTEEAEEESPKEEKPSNLVQFPGKKKEKPEDAEAEEEKEEVEEEQEEEMEDAVGREEAPRPETSIPEIETARKLVLCDKLKAAAAESEKFGGLADDSRVAKDLDSSLRVIVGKEMRASGGSPSGSGILEGIVSTTFLGKARRLAGRAAEKIGDTRKRGSQEVGDKTGTQQTGDRPAAQEKQRTGDFMKSFLGKEEIVVEDKDKARTRKFLKDHILEGEVGEKKVGEPERKSKARTELQKAYEDLTDSKQGKTWVELATRKRKFAEETMKKIAEHKAMENGESLAIVLSKNPELKEAFVKVQQARESVKRIEAQIKRELAYNLSKAKFKSQGKELWTKSLLGTTGGALMSLDIGKAEKGAGAVIKNIGGFVFAAGSASVGKIWERARRQKAENFED